jgi:cysteine desulfuration protein SufE
MTDQPLSTIQAKQDEIIQAFQALEGDREAMLYYLMELGEQMPLLDEAYKTDANLIKGCMSAVWLQHSQQGDRLFFEADSNTAITKGLISLLVRVLSGQPVKDILQADLYFIERIDMGQLIGSQRSSGFASMIKQLRVIAVAHQLKIDQQSHDSGNS